MTRLWEAAGCPGAARLQPCRGWTGAPWGSLRRVWAVRGAEPSRGRAGTPVGATCWSRTHRGGQVQASQAHLSLRAHLCQGLHPLFPKPPTVPVTTLPKPTGAPGAP